MNKKIAIKIFIVIILLAGIIWEISILQSKRVEVKNFENAASQNSLKQMPIKNYPDESIAFIAPVASETLKIGQEYSLKWTPFRLDSNKLAELWLIGNGNTAVQIASNCTDFDTKNGTTQNCFDSEAGEIKWVPQEMAWSILRLADDDSEPIKYKFKLVIGQNEEHGEILSLAHEKEILSQDFNLVEANGDSYLLENYNKELVDPNISILTPKEMEKIKVGSSYQVTLDDNEITFGLCANLVQKNKLIKSYFCKQGIFGGKNILTPASFFNIDTRDIGPGRYTIELNTKRYCDQYLSKQSNKIEAVCFPERNGSVDIIIIK